MRPPLTPLRRRAVLAAGLAMVLAACAGMERRQPESGWIAPMQAVQFAAAAEGRPVEGVFAMRVRAVGSERGRVFLNSEADYRDQRNLTVVLEPRVAEVLGTAFGGPLDEVMPGRWIEVSGAARRVRINFTHDGMPSGKYYYQTHVAVVDPGLLRLLPDRSRRW